VQLRDIASGAEVKSVSHQMDVTKSARLTADGKKVLVAGGYFNNSKTPQSYYVRLWDVTSDQESFRLEYPKRTTFRGAVLVAKDTRIVTVGPQGSLSEWDVATGKERRVWAKLGITCLATSADGRYVVAAGYETAVRLWDVDTGRIVDSYLVRNLAADSIALSRDARRVLIGDRDGTVVSFEFTGLPKQAVSEPPVK
jgi:WD40 repeat protein